MPIITRVPELVAEKFGGESQVNMKQIEKDTGLNYVTVYKWVKGTVNRAEFKTISVWCEYFGCDVADVLVRVED